ncbi:MAG TPA: hypothetical protein VKU87_09130 [Thermomicrobiaceae bacterium]|nr:hypothetical protein [Thermomicrobiaceae bacterium]
MAPIIATLAWSGPSHDQLTVLAVAHGEFGADWPEDGLVTFLRETDPEGAVTGRMIGVEIDDFLQFDSWHDLPDGPEYWQTAEDPPATLATLLRRVQARLRLTHAAHATVAR